MYQYWIKVLFAKFPSSNRTLPCFLYNSHYSFVTFVLADLSYYRGIYKSQINPQIYPFILYARAWGEFESRLGI